jgi:ketosteroid isomerase-like protein
MAHANEDRIRKGYEAFSTGNFQALDEIFAEDILWHVGGRNPFTGDYKGRQEVYGFFAKLAENSGGTFRLEIHDVLANDEHGVAFVHTSAQREGRILDDNTIHAFELEGGRVKEFWGYPGDQYAADEFWS